MVTCLRTMWRSWLTVIAEGFTETLFSPVWVHSIINLRVCAHQLFIGGDLKKRAQELSLAINLTFIHNNQCISDTRACTQVSFHYVHENVLGVSDFTYSLVWLEWERLKGERSPAEMQGYFMSRRTYSVTQETQEGFWVPLQTSTQNQRMLTSHDKTERSMCRHLLVYMVWSFISKAWHAYMCFWRLTVNPESTWYIFCGKGV